MRARADAEAVLLAHRWPGNVRELENAVERAMVVGKGPALEVRDLPVAAPVDLGPCFVPNRQQHHATLVLAALLRHRPDSTSKIVGIVPVDLFIPVLTFVFGQAQLDGPGAVVSTYRLRSEFYGLPGDEGVLVERAIKECIHELGHAFGLVHCDFYDCVMHASPTVDEVDVKSAAFCGHCVSELEGRGWE